MHTTTDYCYTYCNITVAADIASWSSCLADNIDQTDFNELDLGCVADFPDDGSASTGVDSAIATTWPVQQVVETVLSSGSVVATMTVSGTWTQQTPTSTQMIAASAISCKTQGSGCSLVTSVTGVINSATPSTAAKNAAGSVFVRRKFKVTSVFVSFMSLAAIL